MDSKRKKGRTNFSTLGRPSSLDGLAQDNVRRICEDEPDKNECMKRWIINGE